MIIIAAACCAVVAWGPGVALYRFFFPHPETEAGHIRYGRIFNDRQQTHLSAAKKYGIEPLENRDSARFAVKGMGLAKVKGCRNYFLFPMMHSIPYLTANAASLLDIIGENFRDSLASRNMGQYKIVVTSLLRTYVCYNYDYEISSIYSMHVAICKWRDWRSCTTYINKAAFS